MPLFYIQFKGVCKRTVNNVFDRAARCSCSVQGCPQYKVAKKVANKDCCTVRVTCHVQDYVQDCSHNILGRSVHLHTLSTVQGCKQGLLGHDTRLQTLCQGPYTIKVVNTTRLQKRLQYRVHILHALH